MNLSLHIYSSAEIGVAFWNWLLISQLPMPELVLLPELALPSYMPNQKIWEYADTASKKTSQWAMELAKKYTCYLGVGYVDYDNGDYFNRYLLAGENQIYGIVTKSEGEAAVFKRGWFDNIIKTPFGNVAIGICYDSRRKNLYKNIKDEKISLIVFPHGSPADPKKDSEEKATNEYVCTVYSEAFGVPVIYINSYGKLEYMPGTMGFLMKLSGFTMNGRSKIYASAGTSIPTELTEAQGHEVILSEKERKKDITFYGNDLLKGNYFFRQMILKPDITIGIRKYNKLVKKSLNVTSMEVQL